MAFLTCAGFFAKHVPCKKGLFKKGSARIASARDGFLFLLRKIIFYGWSVLF